jgi:hypothetical protein
MFKKFIALSIDLDPVAFRWANELARPVATATKRRRHMQLTMKRGSLFLGLLAALIATMALASSSASATPFCVGQKVNNANKCWGASRQMEVGIAEGESTGVCVGADTTTGTCAPTGQQAIVGVPYGPHAPWVIGTASAFTVVGFFTHTNP